jgi:hypothetical protein
MPGSMETDQSCPQHPPCPQPRPATAASKQTYMQALPILRAPAPVQSLGGRAVGGAGAPDSWGPSPHLAVRIRTLAACSTCPAHSWSQDFHPHTLCHRAALSTPTLWSEPPSSPYIEACSPSPATLHQRLLLHTMGRHTPCKCCDCAQQL